MLWYHEIFHDLIMRLLPEEILVRFSQDIRSTRLKKSVLDSRYTIRIRICSTVDQVQEKEIDRKPWSCKRMISPLHFACRQQRTSISFFNLTLLLLSLLILLLSLYKLYTKQGAHKNHSEYKINVTKKCCSINSLKILKFYKRIELNHIIHACSRRLSSVERIFVYSRKIWTVSICRSLIRPARSKGSLVMSYTLPSVSDVIRHHQHLQLDK